MPSRTLQRRGSPSQPSRFLPLNSGRKPSSAKAANENKSSSANFVTVSAPFNFQRPDLHVLFRPVLRASRHFRNLLHHVVAFDDFAEHAVLVVQPRRRRDGHEKLAAVAIGTGVGHREHARFSVFQLGMKLVGEFVARPAAARTLGASALDHEIRTHAMKNEAVIKRLPGFAPLSETEKILYRPGRP